MRLSIIQKKYLTMSVIVSLFLVFCWWWWWNYMGANTAVVDKLISLFVSSSFFLLDPLELHRKTRKLSYYTCCHSFFVEKYFWNSRTFRKIVERSLLRWWPFSSHESQLNLCLCNQMTMVQIYKLCDTMKVNWTE